MSWTATWHCQHMAIARSAEDVCLLPPPVKEVADWTPNTPREVRTVSNPPRGGMATRVQFENNNEVGVFSRLTNAYCLVRVLPSFTHPIYPPPHHGFFQDSGSRKARRWGRRGEFLRDRNAL